MAGEQIPAKSVELSVWRQSVSKMRSRDLARGPVAEQYSLKSAVMKCIS
jgi:hypothetical protein